MVLAMVATEQHVKSSAKT